MRPPHPHSLRPTTQLLTAIFLATAVLGCGSTTGLGNGGGNPAPGLTHPVGVVAAVDTLPGTPLDAAISKNGVVLAAMEDANLLRRGTDSSMTFTDSVTVGDTPLRVVIDRAGTTAYVLLFTGDAVDVVDLASNTIKTTIPLTSAGVGLILAPDGSRVYAATSAGALFVADAISDVVLDTIELGFMAGGLAFNVEGSALYASSGGSGSVIAIDPVTDRILRRYAVAGAPAQIAVSPDGRTVYAANLSSIDALDVGTGLVTHLPSGAAAYGLAMTPDGAQLYAVLPSTSTVLIIDRATLRLRSSLQVGGRPLNVSFDPLGDVAVIANQSEVFFVR